MSKYLRLKDVHDERDHKYQITANIDTPLTVDLRPKCSPIGDQGRLGACSGYAIVGALEYLENIQQEQFIKLSEAFVYYNERLLEGTTDKDSGAALRDGIKVIAKYGVCEESLWPYHVTKFRD